MPEQGPKPLFALTVFKEGIAAQKIKAAHDSLLVTDPNGPTVLTLKPSQETGQIASGGSKLPNLLTTFFGETGILALTKEGIYSVDQASGDATQIITSDSLWCNIIDAES